MPMAKTMNSSPPILPSTASFDIFSLMILANSISILSPISCPYISFTSLKESRSMIIRVPSCPAQSTLIFSFALYLLYNPVSLSIAASSSVRCIFRLVIKEIITMITRTAITRARSTMLSEITFPTSRLISALLLLTTRYHPRYSTYFVVTYSSPSTL